MQRWKVWHGCGAMCRTVTMVTNVTNCHVTTHSVSPFPRLLKFSPPPLPSGASVLVSASDSEGCSRSWGACRVWAGTRGTGWRVLASRDHGTLAQWIRHLKSRYFKYVTFPFCQRLKQLSEQFLRTWWEFGAWCRLVAIPFSSILPWRLQYGRHLEQNCFRFHQNPWPRQDDPLSCIYSIYSLLLDSTRVLAATPPTLGRSLDIGVMTTDIPNSSSPAQQRCWRERDVYN